MATFKVQKELTAWNEIIVEADSWEEAITIAESEENDFNWEPLDGFVDTGAYWVENTDTDESYCNQSDCNGHN